MHSSDFDFDVITGPSVPEAGPATARRHPEPAPQRAR